MTGDFGKLFKELRSAQGKTLRQLCHENGFQPATISRIERGRLPPPRSPVKLGDYAAALGIEPGADMEHFFDLAAIEAGRLPKSVLEDKELVGKLPVLLRKMTDRDLEKLAEEIRGA